MNLSNIIKLLTFSIIILTSISLKPKIQKVPFLIAPSDIVISCSFPLDMDKLANIQENYLGGILEDITLQKELIIEDRVCPNACKDEFVIYGYPGTQIPEGLASCELSNSLFDKNNPDKIFQLNLGFWGYSSSLKNTSLKILDKRINNLGKIERQYTLIDGNVEYSVIQKIWIIYCKELFINRLNLCDPNDDLEWPTPACIGHITITGSCASKDDSIYFPLILRNGCRSLRFKYSDGQIKIDSSGSSFTRNWEVYDDNIYNKNGDLNRGRASFSQHFIIIDTIKPSGVISFQNCRDDQPIYNHCLNHIDLFIKSEDDCSRFYSMKHQYEIDINNDNKGKYGNYDILVGPGSLDDYFKKTPIPNLDNQYAIDIRNTTSASGSYPKGTHKICWTFQDISRNSTKIC